MEEEEQEKQKDRNDIQAKQEDRQKELQERKKKKLQRPGSRWQQEELERRGEVQGATSPTSTEEELLSARESVVSEMDLDL